MLAVVVSVLESAAGAYGTAAGVVIPPGRDVYVADGSETSLAVHSGNPDILLAGYNEGWNFNPDIPHSSSLDGNETWMAREFPVGSGSFSEQPFDPWVVAGNDPAEFFSTQIRRGPQSEDTSRVVVARSTDGGATFSSFAEVATAGFQDRAMLDVDRTEGQGGGAGTAHDGLLYVTYDIFEPVTRAYLASVLRMTRTSESFELVVSHRDDSSFGGSQLQPFAGVADGTLYLMGSALTADSSGTVAIFHELTNGGAGPNHLSKSALAWPTAGQQLGTSGRWGVNGHRIDTNGYAAIDRSQGPRRGWLYLVSNRNPNPGDPGSDQGDIFVSYSPDGAGTWYFNTLPTEPGKTQYFPMLDVDADGGLHVAYYQNEAGTEHAGVLNAAAASLYYAVSDDGGETWSVPVRLNADENALRFPDPPPDRSQGRYYLIGDYAQLRVVGGRSSRKAYVLWTGFDDNRTGAAVGQAKARVLCTTIACIDVPAPVADKISRALQKAKELRGLAAAATPHRAKRLARKGRKGLRKATRLTTKVARRGNISDACRAQLEGRLEDAERLMASP